MQPADDPKPAGCGGQCSRCSLGQDVPGTPRGWRLVLPAAGMFVLPILLAVLGAVLAGAGEARQTVGAFGGLLVGLIIAIAAGKFVQGKSEGNQPDCPGEETP